MWWALPSSSNHFCQRRRTRICISSTFYSGLKSGHQHHRSFPMCHIWCSYLSQWHRLPCLWIALQEFWSLLNNQCSRSLVVIYKEQLDLHLLLLSYHRDHTHGAPSNQDGLIVNGKDLVAEIKQQDAILDSTPGQMVVCTSQECWSSKHLKFSW